jgi:hypothetical protein
VPEDINYSEKNSADVVDVREKPMVVLKLYDSASKVSI